MTDFSINSIVKALLAYSLCVLPADKVTKRPTVEWKAYQDRLPTETEWDEWAKTALGICIVTGRASDNLIVIDFDDKGSRFEAWKQKLPKELFDRLVIVQTQSGGYHVYTRCDAEPIGNVKLARTAEKETLIETRGEGGLVIAPPTPGYKILAGSIERIPVLPPDEMNLLLDAARSFDEMPKRNTRSTATSAASPKKPVGKKKAVERAIAYINKMPEAIEGCNGSADAMRAANKLYEFGLDIDTAKQVFIEHYNPRCKPEWSEKEIDHKLDTAYNKPLKEAGCMLTSDIVLDPKKPLLSADKFLETFYTFNGMPTLTHYGKGYWQWEENAYREIEVGKVEQTLLHFLERAKIEYRNKEDDAVNYGEFPITPHNVNSIEKMLKMRVFQPTSDAVPYWTGGESSEIPSSVTDPSQLIFGKSKILNLADMGILPPSPRWFNFAALDFDYDPNAECPQWHAFLDSTFGDDEESKQTLMEWMGLCLTSITKFQKALFLVGKIRSGKGTISRILQKIVGSHNSVTPNSSDFGERFGLEPFIGKTLAVTSDARINRLFATQLVERVLNITGEDTITINRKNKSILVVRLQTKLMFISNEIPNVIDKSGAFASRFIFLKLPKSFYGEEDLELEDKLSSELPGILRLAVRHLQSLLERGRFIQPETGKRLAERMIASSSPITVFMQILPPDMSRNDIWEKWTAFCDETGEEAGKKSDLWSYLESADYNCDFDKTDILEKIQEHGGESTVQRLKNGISKYHPKGGSETLQNILNGMVDAGRLVIRIGKYNVEYYRIPNALPDPIQDDGD